jgi:uroporphyrinogen III methyltransferase / synthase
VVPGVSSASGALAYAGIPMTDRRLSSMVSLVTGHEGQGKQVATVDWSRLSRQSTLVIFMGLDQLDYITERLMKHLWPRELPAALIRWGTTFEQQVVEGTLGDIAEKAKDAKLASPVLAVIGKVVALRKKLRWFDNRPLFGRKVMITRALDQVPEFARVLENYGAQVIPFPTIQIVPPRTWEPVDQALKNIARYDWLLFTSVNGVRAFFTRMHLQGIDIRELRGIRIGAIGPKTSARLSGFGLRVDAFPDEYRAEALADAVGIVKGAHVLLASAEEGRDVLPKTLQARGARVTIAPVYRTIKRRQRSSEMKRRLLAHEIDVVTFTSSSTVDGFMRHFNAREKRRIFEHTKAAAIGPITAATLQQYGVRSAIRANRFTIEALGNAILKYFASHGA